MYLKYRILDDIEMYEQQTPFELADYIGLSYFLNNFLFRGIQESIFGNFKIVIFIDWSFTIIIDQIHELLHHIPYSNPCIHFCYACIDVIVAVHLHHQIIGSFTKFDHLTF